MGALPSYQSMLSNALVKTLLAKAEPVEEVAHCQLVGTPSEYESQQALQFMTRLLAKVGTELLQVLNQREKDRDFIDRRTKVLSIANRNVLGFKDAIGRCVIGPLGPHFCLTAKDKPITPLPTHLQGHHVTLFGPPDSAKLAINAMNSFYRQLNDEPSIINEILQQSDETPKWGADDEDSKTPLRQDLLNAFDNLSQCFDKSIEYIDGKTEKKYQLKQDKLAQPIKRIPGLALPYPFLFYKKKPVPLHIYDFALHVYHHWHDNEALTFYIPKLENEEEALYLKSVIETTETLLKSEFPQYQTSSIKVILVIENPRAIFRLHEMIDALGPYFAGASLGWHDYLASTARLFKEDKHYRIPVKADPDIVIKYIKASHDILADVVGSRGGIKIGGMYGVLPIDSDRLSPSFQVSLKGYIKDVITQLKRNLSGFWVAHPDFVRLGLALVEAWKRYQQGNKEPLLDLIDALLNDPYKEETLQFIQNDDIQGLNPNAPHYAEELIVATLRQSNIIANNHPEEIRYNVFQTLQYLCDWLSGNGCVALPAHIEGHNVRIMDDLATCERSRWEVWHELYHGRFELADFLVICHEELLFIRKDLSHNKKQVAVKWQAHNAKWYPVAFHIMLQLMTDKNPCEFASELLLPFTIDEIRQHPSPLEKVMDIDKDKYQLPQYVQQFNYFFEICGEKTFADTLAKKIIFEKNQAFKLIRQFNTDAILNAARFHGDIGEDKKTLDKQAREEQAASFSKDEKERQDLLNLGGIYQEKFGFKFLISAKGKSMSFLRDALKKRLLNDEVEEIKNARSALWQISEKRFITNPPKLTFDTIEALRDELHIVGAQVAISTHQGDIQQCAFGSLDNEIFATSKSLFQMASLSKTIASSFSVEFFHKRGISLDSPVNGILSQTASPFRIPGNEANKVTLKHLMNHTALTMHYVNGFSTSQAMPSINDLLQSPEPWGYSTIELAHTPGTSFQYSGGGYLLLEHLIEMLAKESVANLLNDYLKRLNISDMIFDNDFNMPNYLAKGHDKDGKMIEGGYLKFPLFAAGGIATAQSMLQFLQQLADSYQNIQGTAGISHASAIEILNGIDKGAIDFIGAKAGLGTFVIEAEHNRLMLHQGANDGFRAFYLYCFKGPDYGKGITIFANGEDNATRFIATVSQLLLQALNIQGIDFSKFKKKLMLDKKTPKSQRVNLAFKQLFLDAFIPDLPLANLHRGKKEPLSQFNLASSAKIRAVSNQQFARADNLISAYAPVFEPTLFGRHGKVMDSWESARHNQQAYESLTLDLKKESNIYYISLSTEYHLGNQVESVELIAHTDDGEHILLKKTHLEGHSRLNIKSEYSGLVKAVTVRAYPDGGLTRLGLYDTVPDERLFTGMSEPFSEPMSKTMTPMAPENHYSDSDIEQHWQQVKDGQSIDVASQYYGGKLIEVSNDHFGHASQVLSSLPPIGMFDGFESARSRAPNHHEYLLIKLARPSRLNRIVFDFRYFLHNNPREIEAYGRCGEDWFHIIAKSNVKAYAGNQAQYMIKSKMPFSEVKVLVYPDGGINRIQCYSEV